MEVLSPPIESLMGARAAEPAVHSALELIDHLYSYNHWIYDTVRPFIQGRVCEVGSGTGNITQFLLRKEHIVGIEPYEQSLRKAQRRFVDHLNVCFVGCRLEQCPNDEVNAGSFDTVLCLNVLEHLEEDVAALTTMRTLCRPDGRVVILVPAMMSIYGEMDRSYGHYRRYNRRSLGRAFAGAGLEVSDSFYMNAIGAFGWLWEGRIMKRPRIRAKAARAFNRMVPFVDALERLIRPPFGQSIVMVGHPPT